jgi:hypothetical protein
MRTTHAMSIQRAAAWWAKRSGTPRPHRSTLIRWATRGVNGLRLRAERSGGRWYVTEGALAEFHRALNEQSIAIPTAGPVRVLEVAAAMRRLEEITAPRYPAEASR